MVREEEEFPPFEMWLGCGKKEMMEDDRGYG
jgi:hypothetical protein